MTNLAHKLATVVVVLLLTGASPSAQQQSDSQQGTFLLTIFLKHDQSKTLEQINSQLREQGFYKAFPPAGIEVVSWYVMMGLDKL